MRDLLIEHMDGRAVSIASCRQRKTVRNAIARGLLVTTHDGVQFVTRITEHGRAALSRFLAEWIEEAVEARLAGSGGPDDRESEAFLRIVARFWCPGQEAAE